MLSRILPARGFRGVVASPHYNIWRNKFPNRRPTSDVGLNQKTHELSESAIRFPLSPSRNNAVEKGSTRVPRVICGVSPQISSNHFSQTNRWAKMVITSRRRDAVGPALAGRDACAPPKATALFRLSSTLALTPGERVKLCRPCVYSPLGSSIHPKIRDHFYRADTCPTFSPYPTNA